MKRGTLEKFSLRAVADAVSRKGLSGARDALSPMIGAAVDVSGRVQKVVKRDGQFKLVIEPGDVPGFVVFADCRTSAENLIKLNIRKGSAVSIRGKLLSFGNAGANLGGCRLVEVAQNAHLKKGKFGQVRTKKKGKLDEVGTQKKEKVT